MHWHDLELRESYCALLLYMSATQHFLQQADVADLPIYIT